VRPADLENLQDLFGVEGDDDGTAVRAQLDQAFRMQHAQRLTYRHAADAELAGEGVMVQTSAGREAALKDGGPESVRRQVLQCPVGQRVVTRVSVVQSIASNRDGQQSVTRRSARLSLGAAR
jgi:hypothetical protein